MSHRSRRRLGPAPAARRRSSPRLERLEDRRLLATFNPDPSAADGSPGSLRDAIIQADSNGQDNTIVLQAGAYVLTVPNMRGEDNGAAQGDLDLSGSGYTIRIEGAGEFKTVIDATNLGDRIFKILPGVTATISDLTITNGNAVDDSYSGAAGISDALGGGVLNAGMTELDRVSVLNCSATGGPGQNGTPGNTVAGSPGYSASGGGIFNVGTLTLNQCLLDSDTAEGGNGGNGSTSNDESGVGGAGGTGYGGGIDNVGSLTVSQSSISSNFADGGNGGNGGRNNLGTGPSGGQGGDGYGGGVFVEKLASKTTIVDSTIAENVIYGGYGGGGGQGGYDPSVGLVDAGGNGGNGGAAEGGGIDAAAQISLYNSTVAENQVIAQTGGQGGFGPSVNGSASLQGQQGNAGTALAGGIRTPTGVGSPALLTSISTIIALNTSDQPSGSNDTADDVALTFAYAANTLLQDRIGAAGIFSGVAGDLVGVDPGLGPLEDNGGPTPTMALKPDSPAIDAGSNPLGLTVDQRGDPRVVGGATDIGAYELGASAPPGGSGASPAGSGGGTTTNVQIQAMVVEVKHHRAIRVINPATGAVKFTVYPFGKGYRGKFAISTVTVGGVEDLVARSPKGHKRFLTAVFSGIDGSPLPSSLA